ncbi:MAG: PAS domain S-box protein [Luteibaculaceae bacterium]
MTLPPKTLRIQIKDKQGNLNTLFEIDLVENTFLEETLTLPENIRKLYKKELFYLSSLFNRDYTTLISYNFILPAKDKDDLLLVDLEVLKRHMDIVLNNALFNSVVANLNEYVILTDVEGIISYISPNIEKITGYRPAFLIGKHIIEFSKQLSTEVFKTDLIDILDNQGASKVINHQITTNLGENKSFKTTLLNYLQNPEIQGILFITQDITQILDYKYKWHKDQKMLNMFFENELFGVFSMLFNEPFDWKNSPNKTESIEFALHNLFVRKVNRTFLDQYETDEENLLEKTPYDFFEHDLDQERWLLSEIFEKEKIVAESEEKTHKGKTVFFEAHYQVIKNEKGKYLGVFGLQKDITDKKLNEKTLLENSKALREITWMQSHLFRAPIANILGLCELSKSNLNKHNLTTEHVIDYIEKLAKELDGIVHTVTKEIQSKRTR